MGDLTLTRPCSRWDPRWWETGNEGNGEAIVMCGWCPFKDVCLAENPDPRGVIVAGVPYDDCGYPLPVTCVPGIPVEPPPAKPARTADHHDEIMRRRDDGATWTQIAIALNLSRYAVKGYGRRQVAARERVAA